MLALPLVLVPVALQGPAPANASASTSTVSSATRMVQTVAQRNGTFERGAQGWAATKTRPKRLVAARVGVARSRAAVLKVTPRRGTVLSNNPNAAQGVRSSDVYHVSAWVRTTRPGIGVRLSARQVSGKGTLVSRTAGHRSANRSWRLLRTTLAAAPGGGSIDVRVHALPGPRGRVVVDNINLVRSRAVTQAVYVPVRPPTPAPTTPPVSGPVKPPTTPPVKPPTTPAPTTPPVTPPVTPPPTTPPSSAPASWGEPTWRDEFNGTAIDPKKWNVRTQSNLGLTIDSAIPDAGQVDVEGGLLHLRGDWLPNAPQTRAASATGVKILTHKTGYIDQRGLRSGDVSLAQRYGRWEIRAKTPTGTNTLGALAAFWLRNGNSGEIDMMEAWGYGTDFPSSGKALKDTAKTTVFTNTNTTSSLVAQVRHREFGVTSKPWEGFHNYAFELLPDSAAMYVDGKKIWSVTPATLPALWGPSFQTPLHMRLNLHVGPSAAYWGLPDAANKHLTKPLDFQVDYVRVYGAS